MNPDVIKVNPQDEPPVRAKAISDGIEYACTLLHSEYGWSAMTIELLLERIIDSTYDSERSQAAKQAAS